MLEEPERDRDGRAESERRESDPDRPSPRLAARTPGKNDKSGEKGGAAERQDFAEHVPDQDHVLEMLRAPRNWTREAHRG